jgi:integrase
LIRVVFSQVDAPLTHNRPYYRCVNEELVIPDYSSISYASVVVVIDEGTTPNQRARSLEAEIDSLIAGCGPKTATLLQLLKETGMRIGEALQLKWQDLDFERSTISINNPEKGSLSRILPISKTLKAMLNSFVRKEERIFPVTMNTVQSNFRTQRRSLAKKLKNPRLKRITFHTFRHFFATILYAKTSKLLIVQRALVHKNINNTIIYTHLIDFKSDDYKVQTAETVEEAKKLGEAGYEHYDTINKVHLYRKRK